MYEPAVELYTTQSGSNYSATYDPTGYSGTSYSHPFILLPPRGQSNFPQASPNSVTVTASDSVGGDNGSYSNMTSTSGSVNMTAGATSNHNGNLGSGLTITIKLGYGSGEP